MLQPTTITLDGASFQLVPLPVLKAARLEKRVATTLAPVLAGLGSLDPQAQVDLRSIANGVAAALQSLDDDAYLGMVRELLASAVYLPDGAAPVPLTDESALNQAFTGRLLLMYKLAVEVMKFNKFSFFAMAGRLGGLTLRTATSSAAAAGEGINGGASVK